MAKRASAQANRGLIAKVKIGQKQLGMSDEQYRDMLADRYGKESATQLGIRELKDCVRHMESLGAIFTTGRGKGRDRDPEGFYVIPDGTRFARQKRYIAALWVRLGWKASGLDMRARQQFGVDRFLWMDKEDDLQCLAKDLNNRCRRKGIDPDARFG